MTIKQKLLQDLTFARYNVLINSTDGAFDIPRGFEQIWTDREAFFEAVKSECIWHIDTLYAFNQLERINYDPANPIIYAQLEETLAHYIDLVVHNAYFKERLNAYSIKLEQGYSYDSKDMKLVKPNDQIPKTIIAALNNTGIRVQIESYNIREGGVDESDAATFGLEPWQFKDNGLTPQELNWSDKVDASTYNLNKQETDNKINELQSFKGTTEPKITDLETKTQPLEKVSDGVFTWDAQLGYKSTQALNTIDDNGFIPKNVLVDELTPINQAITNNTNAITQTNTKIDAEKQRNDTQDISISTLNSQVETLKDNLLQVERLRGLLLFEGSNDHSTDVSGTTNGNTTSYSIPHIKTDNDNDGTPETRNHEIISGDVLSIQFYGSGQNIVSTPINYELGKTSTVPVVLGSKTFNITNVVDVNNDTFSITISGANLDTVKVHEVVLLQASGPVSNALTQLQADVRYAPLSDPNILGGTQSDKGTSANIYTNASELWANLTNFKNAINNKTILKSDGTYGKLDDIVGVNNNPTDPNTILTTQGGVQRLISENETIKDLTALTTQQDLFNAIEANGWYITYSAAGRWALMHCATKTATTALLEGFRNEGNKVKVVYSSIASNSNGQIPYQNNIMGGANAVADEDFTTKAQVDSIIKNITNLTTQAQLFNAVETGKWYLVKSSNSNNTAIAYCAVKTATEAQLDGITRIPIDDSVASVYITATQNAATGIMFNNQHMTVKTPTLGSHATTKDYVDSGGNKTDITATYATRTWTAADDGKRVELIGYNSEDDEIVKLEGRLTYSANGIVVVIKPNYFYISNDEKTYLDWKSPNPAFISARTATGAQEGAGSITQFFIWE